MPSTEKFHVPLHLHTEFSLLDGASKISHLCKKAKEHNMPALAITDHGTMFGVYTFYHEAKKQGIKPIIGCEVYIVNGDHREKGKRTKLFHLVLLAKNDLGYKNLIKICSEGCINGFYYKPRISKAYLEEHAEGIIALSACLGGEVNNNLLAGNYEAAKAAALEYKAIFQDDFYLEIQDHLYPEDRKVNPLMIELAQDIGVKIVATNDSHYTNKEDARAHDALLCLQMQKFVSDFPRMRFSSHEYLKTGEEMFSLFRDHLPEDVITEVVYDNTMEIYEKVSDYESFAQPGMHLPDPELPSGHSFETYLKEISYAGALERFSEISEDVSSRLDLELQVMADSGFASYFIVVWDFIRWARERKIPVGPGRGSAAGSLVAYCLGITNIDPLKYGLLFERFLNPERKSMPDIDTDFCIDRREEVISYVREKYGEDCVCQIITFNRLTSRSVIKDMARVLEYPYAKAEDLAKMIPVVRGKPRTIEWMLGNHGDFKKYYDSDPEAKQVIELALKNEGLNKTYGVHAAGVIIANKPITEVIPTARSNDGSIITQFAMEEAANMGLLKMDFLGLRNLTMINKALEIIQETNPDQSLIDIDKVSMDDEATFDTICSGHLSGIFQLETSAGMKQVARDLAPRNIEDISALIALYRPGPLDTGMIDDFINRKSGKQEIKYDHPLLEPLLRNTYATIVYQEQIMQITQVLGGFSLGEADLLRRAMGKKKPEVLLPYKDRFVQGCLQNEHPEPITQELADKLFEQMLAFAEYCFNKSHSTAYGFITYQTAYLKTHYPIEYLTALFISCDGDTDKIKFYIKEAQRLDIKIEAPDINKSSLDFKADLENRSIVFGLKAVKGVGTVPAEDLIRERNENGSFKDFYDFTKRINHKSVNKKTIESLIRCGALDSLKAGRKAMIENVEAFIDNAKKAQSKQNSGQLSLFSNSKVEINLAPSYINGEQDEYPERDLQAMEYELLGLFVNNHPMQAIQSLCKMITNHTLSSVKDLKDKAKVKVPVLLIDFVKKITKSKKIICIAQLEDLDERIEGVIFSSKLGPVEHLLVKGKRLLVTGTLSKASEGNASIMIDSLEDLDDKAIVEFDIDLDGIKDYFTFFQSLKSVLVLEPNRGENLVILNLKSGNSYRKMSLGATYKIKDCERLRENIRNMIRDFGILNMV
jgi:DNA polymerase-3 subunit alpha